MPLGLVVKKALNSRSAFSAEIPTPQSVTLTSTCCFSSWRDRITKSRGRSVTDCMASMPFITRLIITWCNWTRSPRILGKVGANSVRTDTRYKVAGQLTLHQRNDGIDVERRLLGICLVGERPDAPDHLARPVAILDDPFLERPLPGRECRSRASSGRPTLA